MKLLHFCYDKLDDALVGPTLSSPHEGSRYWDSLSATDIPPHVDEHYRPAEAALYGAAGAKVVADARRRYELERQWIFERVRQAEFPDRPSRRTCMYTFLSDDPEAYIAAFHLAREQVNLIEIELVGPTTRFHACDLDLLAAPASEEPQATEARARRYWEGVDLRHPTAEILVAGHFRITRIIWHRCEW